MSKYTVIIGYDDRQPYLYEVLRHSILHNTQGEVEVIPLKHEELRKLKIFSHEFSYDEKGNLFNPKDVTQEFIQNRWKYYMYTRARFYVPLYCLKKKIKGQVLYLDPNFLCLPETDIRHLFQWGELHNPILSISKRVKNLYNRSGMVLYNMDNPIMHRFNLHQNKSTLGYLSKFHWIEENTKLLDANIGDIPKAWCVDSNKPEEVQRLMRFSRPSLTYRTKSSGLWIDEYYSYLVDKLVPEAQTM